MENGRGVSVSDGFESCGYGGVVGNQIEEDELLKMNRLEDEWGML